MLVIWLIYRLQGWFEIIDLWYSWLVLKNSVNWSVVVSGTCPNQTDIPTAFVTPLINFLVLWFSLSSPLRSFLSELTKALHSSVSDYVLCVLVSSCDFQFKTSLETIYIYMLVFLGGHLEDTGKMGLEVIQRVGSVGRVFNALKANFQTTGDSCKDKNTVI